MPLVRISLRKDLSDRTKSTVSEIIHRELIKEFRIPENDYFHIIEELEPRQLIYPKEYLGIVHSDQLVFIQIIAGLGRTVTQKRALYAEIAKGISEETIIKSEDVIITLIENDGYANWSFGNGESQKPTHI